MLRYLEAASRDTVQELERQPMALTYLLAIFGLSEPLGETFLDDPGSALQFARDRNFSRLKSSGDLMQDYARFSVTSPDPWFSSQLARFKRRNYLRIALKDVLGIATLGETMLELSTLADVIVKLALAFCDRELEKRHGRPQHRDASGRIAAAGFSAVALGKLGGNELSYSSGIALIFLYSQSGETAGGSDTAATLSNKEYFIRLAEAVTRTIAQSTPHGEVYRVDLGLRPDGQDGDLAIALRSALEYYDHRANDRELDVLVRARHSAGDAHLTREFLQGVQPYVFRPPSATDIADAAAESGDGGSLGDQIARGIRDIERLCQSLQRVHGGKDPWLRAGGTLLALRRLNDKGILADAEYARLSSAYEFFRRLEHRAELLGDQAADGGPASQPDFRRLAQGIGIQLAAQQDGHAALLERVAEYTTEVGKILSGKKGISE